MYVSCPARATFETWPPMERMSAPGVVYAAGGATVIWVDTQRGKAASLPEALRALVAYDFIKNRLKINTRKRLALLF